MILNKSFIILAIVISFNVGSQILFKIAATQVKYENNISDMISKLIFNPAAWGAIILNVSMVLAWIWVLRTLPLSIAYSSLALVFILVPIVSHFYFDEQLTTKFLIGIALIISGLCLIHLT